MTRILLMWKIQYRRWNYSSQCLHDGELTSTDLCDSARNWARYHSELNRFFNRKCGIVDRAAQCMQLLFHCIWWLTLMSVMHSCRDCNRASFPTDWRRIADNYDLMQVRRLPPSLSLSLSLAVTDVFASLPICVYIRCWSAKDTARVSASNNPHRANNDVDATGFYYWTWLLGNQYSYVAWCSRC